MRTTTDQIKLRKMLNLIGKGLDENGRRTKNFKVPKELLATSLEEQIDFCFPRHVLENPKEHWKELCEAAILAPRYQDVETIGNLAMSRLPGQSIDLFSIDEPLSCGDPLNQIAVYRADFNIESIHNETPSGLPPHKLTLKVKFFKNLSVMS